MEANNLLTHYGVEKSERFKNEILKLNQIVSDTNTEFNLKAGDKIQFYSGYNDDILYISQIIGFDKYGDAYIIWDCYWYTLKLKKVKFEKID